jgi:hypothetical protein
VEQSDAHRTLADGTSHGAKGLLGFDDGVANPENVLSGSEMMAGRREIFL